MRSLRPKNGEPSVTASIYHEVGSMKISAWRLIAVTIIYGAFIVPVALWANASFASIVIIIALMTAIYVGIASVLVRDLRTQSRVRAHPDAARFLPPGSTNPDKSEAIMDMINRHNGLM